MTFGFRLKELRKASGMTQEQLANRLSVTPQAVSRWENNTAMPDISQIIPIANLFQVSTDHLLGVNIAKNEAHIKSVIEDRFNLDEDNANPIEVKLAEFRAEIKNHPSSVALKEKQFELFTLKIYHDFPDQDPADFREMSSLCEDILAEGGGERGNAYYRARLLELAVELKNETLALELLQNVSKLRDCYDVWLPKTLEGPAKVVAKKDLLLNCISYALETVCELYDEDLSAQEYEELHRTEKLLDTFYGSNWVGRIIDIRTLYIPIRAAMKSGNYDEVYERLNDILGDFRRRQKDRPEFSTLISERYRLNSMYAQGLFYTINYEAARLIVLIQKEFPEDILQFGQMKSILKKLRHFANGRNGAEAIVGKEAGMEIINNRPLYDIE